MEVRSSASPTSRHQHPRRIRVTWVARLLASRRPNLVASNFSKSSRFVTPRSSCSYRFRPFDERANAGQTTETLNPHIEVPEPPSEPPAESRIKLKANTELSKFNYKTMSMKLSEASEVLDDRIDEFLELVKAHHNLDDGVFGNPATQSTSDIVAVGRIASDTSEGRLNTASLVLEASRRTGGGLRVPLKVDELPNTDFFAGQIVALRGTNASGEFFAAREILSVPLLNSAASPPTDLDAILTRLQSSNDPDLSPTENMSLTRPLNVLVAAGPYTNSQTMDLSPLHALLDVALETRADGLILTGPFLDTEHPVLRNGDLDFPSDPDTATMATAFRHLISGPLSQLTASLPSISIIVAPSVRDAVSKHAAFPQDRLPKRELGLPKQASTVTNPVTLSVNEAVFGICSADPLDAIRRTEAVGGKSAKQENMLSRLSRKIIEQRSFFPVFPPPARDSGQPLEPVANGIKAEDQEEEGINWGPMGAMLDTSYIKLADWLNCRPDVLVVPSMLTPFAKVCS
jgi:DNA polymerase alpha subunit B